MRSVTADDERDGDEPSGLADLTAFQRDLLWALSHENARKGTALKADLADYYGEAINHSRLYQNLDTLVECDLVAKQARDRRTNEYSLTETARRALEARRAWQAEGDAA
ncbi:helix-turn-helix transcriptional regulator [Halorubrum ezzemoulense]|uniref:Helix-turn-helix transcriptional regulator n=1 Tax=Halorubrum ezzemoulense TaxID=337243 RepID=A0ABT4Z639_HALEZ|nr:helix-turn-helix transcriptional regulator [Halorubrum ezzemoulense]MDB2246375.1 helix-turn-helix transcriptional regulator [Halorubrum ezzemoulense]MDB2280097.1 helix-turn-helix transcriptional regulator [Halorubrum ezzemoulense]MDB2290502.1 helix-turn-helix transcriptional regulator [Halorubrum ezzemoulense]MDB2293623.1 helix-turn-helix transcriptional regulator [Halorubrum ezzemoulense]MDB2297952.1 helix-turn-helix transcriptional regulator [Halorubrum ezzemoulense]